LIADTLLFWEGKKIHSLAFTIMNNHVHWVFETFEKDDQGHPVYVEDIMKSVKQYSATQINQLEKRKGALWQMESFDITIRDEKHRYNAIRYTLNNPVAAGLVTHWKLWPGSYSGDGLS
jgi:REP element-mobilizing transposase RayT